MLDQIGIGLALSDDAFKVVLACNTEQACPIVFDVVTVQQSDGVQFSLGFMKPSTVWPFGSASSFGSPGTAGSLGFADPEASVGTPT